MRFIVMVLLLAAEAARGLGNLWFTYGLWPKSWTSFGIFATVGFVLVVFHVVIAMEDRK